MPHYKLTYFDFRGRAELSRLVFAAAGTDFEDDRMTNMMTWIDLKPTLPFGQLPVLYVDDVLICQSTTIARFLAKEFGLAGRSNVEQAHTDMIVDCVLDMMDPIQPCFREKDQEKKQEMRENFEEQMPGFMEKLEKLLEQNNNGEKYFVGDELTWADLAVMNAWHWLPGFGVFPPTHKFPKLQAHRELVENLPKVAEWLSRRPDTPV